MAKVPRHVFAPLEVQYLNMPLPIGFDKTISQPLMVAVMTDLLELKPDGVQDRGLEKLGVRLWPQARSFTTANTATAYGRSSVM
jgi:protein-L-isoaspartate(D-aspartate) O-methyltransferase